MLRGGYKMMYGLNYLGSIWNKTGFFDITDPMYDRSVPTYRMTVPCVKGCYGAYAFIDTDTSGRVAMLSLYKDSIMVTLDQMKCIGQVGVDSARAGFFINKPDLTYEMKDIFWDFQEMAGMINRDDITGVLCMSGWGDGIYNVFANENNTAFSIVFLEEYLPEEE